MRINQEITERIQYVENFEIIVSGKSTYLKSAEYPKPNASPILTPVS